VVALINLVYTLLVLLILARVLMSWVNVSPYSQLGQTIYNLTEPILAPVRNLLPPMAGFDFSPIIVFIGLQIIRAILLAIFA
jgi:YggT family protein